MNKLEYIVTTMSRPSAKKFENYVVNAIYNRVGIIDLKPVTQQYVKVENSNKYRLIDLYFPQLHYAVEVNEPFHENQVDADKLRTDEIMASIKSPIQRTIFIKDADLSSLNRQIDAVVQEIKSLCSSTLLWEEYDDRIQSIIKEGIIPHGEGFNKVNDLLKLFHKDRKATYKAFYKVADNIFVWSPTLSIIKNGELSNTKKWQNTINEEWTEITEFKMDQSELEERKQGFQKELENKSERYVFAKYKDNYGFVQRRFIGVFVINNFDEHGTIHYRRIHKDGNL